MGQGLALALTQRGRKSLVLGRDWQPATIRQANLVLIAVPDNAIATVATALAAQQAVTQAHVVLHLSGLLDHTILQPLTPTQAAVGSFHPLQSISDPQSAPERLRGAYVGIEGDHRALQAAEALAISLEMKPVRIPANAKPAYHAGAAIASNYTTALLAVAQRLAIQAGIPEGTAVEMYVPLLQGTVANIATLGAAEALTGPIRRGDVQTVQAHLDALSPSDRELYRHLALAALQLAKPSLNPTKLAALETLLSTYA